MATDRRVQRIAQTIHRRQLDLVVALDQVHDRHNVSAVLRTADAVGIPEVLWKPETRHGWSINAEVAQGSDRWVSLRPVPNLLSALTEYKLNGFSIAATHLSSSSVDFRSIDWTTPWVVVLGNERRGCSDDLLAIADVNIILPMVGLVQSLNVSVATAVVLYEIQRVREAAGKYRQTLPRREVEKMYREWELNKEGIALDELLTPPEDDIMSDNHHFDGRNAFAQKLKDRKNSC